MGFKKKNQTNSSWECVPGVIFNWLANKVKCGCSYICQPLRNCATCSRFTDKKKTKKLFLLEKSDLAYFKYWTETVIFLSLHHYLRCAFQSRWLGWEWCLLEMNPPVHNQQGSKQRRDAGVNYPHNSGTISGAQLHSASGWSALGLVPGYAGETPAPEKCPWSCKTGSPTRDWPVRSWQREICCRAIWTKLPIFAQVSWQTTFSWHGVCNPSWSLVLEIQIKPMLLSLFCLWWVATRGQMLP